MTNQDKKEVKETIDYFVEFYSLSLKPYYRAYKILFEKGLFSEIVVDFLRRVNMPANIRIQKVSAIRGTEVGITLGKIDLVMADGRPLHFMSSDFKNTRFLIKIHEDCYKSFPRFITVLVHELSHLVL